MSALPKNNKDYSQLFSETLMDIFTLMYRIYPDKKYIQKVEKKYLHMDRSTYIDYTLNNIKPHVSYLCSQDTSIFGSDYQSGKPLYLLVGLDLKKMWKTVGSSISSEDQETFLTQLQLLFIYGSLAKKVNKSLIRNMIENLKFIQELDQKVAEAEAKEHEKTQFNVESILGKNNPIVELVMEMIYDEKLLKELGLPSELFGRLSSNSDQGSSEPTGPQGSQEPTEPTEPQEPQGSQEPTEPTEPKGPQGPDEENNLGDLDPVEIIRNLMQPENLERATNVFKVHLEAKMREKNMTQETIEQEMKKAAERIRKKFSKHTLYRTLQIDKMIDNFLAKFLATDSNPEGLTYSEPPTEEEAQATIHEVSQKMLGLMGTMQQNMNQTNRSPIQESEFMAQLMEHMNQTQKPTEEVD